MPFNHYCFLNLKKLLTKSIIFLIPVLFVAGCYVSKDSLRDRARLLQKGKIKGDTSYIYSLPYSRGTSRLLVQGYFSNFSHKNRVALDFKMKSGTEVYAARSGVVIRLEEQHSKGGRIKNIEKMQTL